ncbi:MAG: hypothetical protein ACKOXV_06805 [Bacteroidota bacterium]
MTQIEAEEIKNRIEDINKRYAPIKLNFKMHPSLHPYDDDNWFVTIVYNYTENEWMTFFGMTHSYAQVMDKLNGYEFGLEAVQAYQEENGNLKFLAQ